MALWLVRCGRHGEYEQRFLGDNRIYLTWEQVSKDLAKIEQQNEIYNLLLNTNSGESSGKCSNHAGQIWAFSHRMQLGDLVVVPSKFQPVINIAEITGNYAFDKKATPEYRHYRSVKWLKRDIPRNRFDQDLLYSFGAIMTICQISRNDAENRIRVMLSQGSVFPPPPPIPPIENIDLEETGRDRIARLLEQKFKGHNLTRLVEAILKAQGYTTYMSPPGPDKGIDILAAPGPLGFGNPRLCVQVKSGNDPVDSPTLNQLIGSMQNVQADQGLIVSWSGFKQTVERERAVQFFKVRFWNQENIISELLAHYESLDEDLRTEIPLKRIWTVAFQEED
ncbi:MAG: restriction endonuclease [Candidatus Riflebacteria bacterium]|nr:restriction endonuclease [Candidatus Riflebacteria bacterium]